MFCSHYDMLEKSLVKRGFIVHQAKDVNEAKQLAFSLIKPNESVGFGGSVTVQNDLDLYNELEKGATPCTPTGLPQTGARRRAKPARRIGILHQQTPYLAMAG